MTEIWKTIPNFENYYEASNLGRIRSVRRTITQKSHSGVEYTRVMGERILVPLPSSKGYLRVRLSKNGVTTRHSVHRLVLLAHRGECPPGHEACHADDQRTNNRLSNLRWSTPEANIADRFANGGYDFPPRTHCIKRGHPLAGDNLYVNPQGRRSCRECARIRAEERKLEAA